MQTKSAEQTAVAVQSATTVGEHLERRVRTVTVADRWTYNLSLNGFVPVVRSFLRHYACLKISTGQAMFIIQLMDFRRGGDTPLYPRYEKIADYMGITPKMARVHAQRLEAAGLLGRDKETGWTTRFDLTPLFRRLEEHLATPCRRGEWRRHEAQETDEEEG